MFDFIRNHQRWMQVILLLLVVPSFLFIGIQGYSSFISHESKLVEIDGSSITQPDFDQAWRNQIEQVRQQMGAQFDASLVDTPEGRRNMLDQMVNQRILALAASKERLSASDEALREAIAAIPAVQDNGQFSPERYREVLAAQGLTPTRFEAELRGDLATQRVLDPIVDSATPPNALVDRLGLALTQQRSVQLRTFAASDYTKTVTVSDADIAKWYDANQATLQIPQQVEVSYLLLDQAAATAGVQVSDAELQSYYDAHKSQYGEAEQRRISHIMINIPSGADQAQVAQLRTQAQALAAKATPADFAQLARTESQDAGSATQGGDLGWLTADTLPADLGKAAFSLKKGQVSEVIQGADGFHIFLVTDIRPSTVKPFAAVRSQVLDEVRSQHAADRFSDLATKLTSVVNSDQQSLQPAAAATGLTVQHVSGIGRDSLLPANQVQGANPASADPTLGKLFDNARVRTTLYSHEVLDQHLNSGVIELDPGTMLAVHVDRVIPAHVPPLASVTAQIRARLVTAHALDAAKAAGQAALATLQKTPTDAQASQGFGATQTFSRVDAQSVPRAILQAAMQANADKLPAYVGAQTADAYVLIKVSKVDNGNVDDAQRAQLVNQLKQVFGATERDALMQALRAQYHVKVTDMGQNIIVHGDNAPAGN